MAGPGSFGRQADCSIRSEGGLGLNWYTQKQFTEYSLKLDWMLKKDDNGVWRGTATHAGAQVNVTVDYRGNITRN